MPTHPQSRLESETRAIRKSGPTRPHQAATLATTATAATATLAAWQLKRFLAAATEPHLRWLIDPAIRLCNLLPGIHFCHGPRGWVDAASNSVVLPACAGGNFLLICFSLTVVLLLAAGRARLPLLLPAAGLAWAVTVCANAVRIALSVACFRWQAAAFLPVSAAELHRLVGVVIYYLFLLFLSLALSRILQGRGRWRWQLVAPLGCYLFYLLLVPLLRGSARLQGAFLPHLCTVAAVAGGMTLLLAQLRRHTK